MGILKGFKDLKDMAHEAPGLMAQGNQLAAAAQANAAAQQTALSPYLVPSPVPSPRSATTRVAGRSWPLGTASARPSGRQRWTGGTPGSLRTRRSPRSSTPCTWGAEMGLFKDLGDIKRQSKEMSRNSPGAGARMADGMAKMSAATATLSGSDDDENTPWNCGTNAPTPRPTSASTTAYTPPSAGSVPVQAQVLSVQPATGYINGDPIVAVSVLISRAGTPPIPATQSVVVPAMHLPRLQPGVRLAARIDPQDVQAFALDWNASL